MATLNADPVYSDRWLISESDGQAPKLGLQLGGQAGSDLTVYWSGKVARIDMFSIIERAANMLEAGFVPVLGKFITYGKDMREEFKFEGSSQIKPPDQSLLNELWPLVKSPLATFDACRAELTGSQGTVMVWANVTGHTRGGLDKGGENIGLSVPIQLFPNAQPVITYAIEKTTDMRENAISNLLGTLAQDLLRVPPLAR